MARYTQDPRALVYAVLNARYVHGEVEFLSFPFHRRIDRRRAVLHEHIVDRLVCYHRISDELISD